MLYDRLKAAENLEDITKSVEEYHRLNDRAYETYTLSRRTRTVCHEGCTHCCNLRVYAAPFEVLLIAKHIEKHFSAERRSEVLSALETHVAALSKITREGHVRMNTPCPLLSRGICSIYPLRPFRCRAYYSLDIASCRFLFDNPTFEGAVGTTDRGLTAKWDDTIAWVFSIFENRGYDTSDVELGFGVLRSLMDSTVEKKFVGKQKPFEGLRIYLDD